MKIYVRKVFPHDVTHEVSVTTDIVKEYFDSAASMSFEGINSRQKGTVTINNATDPRFGGSYKTILQKEGGIEENDFIVTYKYSKGYALEIIKSSDNRYKTYSDMFKGKERHLISFIDDFESDNNYDVLNHNLFGMHITEKNDALSEDNPHICIGWSAIGDLSSVATKDELKKKHIATWPNKSSRSTGQNVGQVWLFINDMKIGDYVIFAEPSVCHIGRIDSDYYFDETVYENQSEDYKNTRKVTWLKKDISRKSLSKELHNSLTSSRSVWTMNDYKSAVTELLNGKYKKSVDDIENDEKIIIENKSSKVKYTVDELGEILADMYNNPGVAGKSMAPHLFGLKFGEIIDANGISLSDIIEKSGLEATSYKEEIRKGLNIYRSIKNNEYDMSFLDTTVAETSEFDFSLTKGNGINMIFYGVPGCGKSYHIDYEILKKNKETKEYGTEFKKENIIRTTFYQDYSNTDFVGQILPKVTGDKVEYIFNPGPFTLALIRAISNPNEKVALVVEEINRGNAPAIFGDIFQLLDRDEETSISEYGIKNVSVIDFLNDYNFEVNNEIVKYNFDEIKIPGNMYIYATMNTSDQNVYTLDTAFTRRWEKEKIKNVVEDCTFGSLAVPGMNDYTWAEFVDSINKCIRDNIEDLQVNEDKQIGAYFIRKSLLLSNNAEKFAYKVFEYLWSDVAKLDHDIFFNSYNTLDELIKAYKDKGVGVFKTGIFDAKATISEREEENDE